MSSARDRAATAAAKRQRGFSELVAEVNPEIEVVGRYQGRNAKIRIRCRKCGLVREVLADSIARRRYRCQGCRQLGRDDTLDVLRPDLAAQWDAALNDGLTPAMCTLGSCRKVWWRCPECGRVWRAQVFSRVSGCGCPDCAREAASLAKMRAAAAAGCSLADVKPDVASEWDRGLNGELTPFDVSANSARKVWWRCPDCGEAYLAAPRERSHGKMCPVCGTLSRAHPARSLATASPADAALWDAAANGGIGPENVKPSSAQEFAWKCPICGAKWTASCKKQTQGRRGCAHCGYMDAEKAAQRRRAQAKPGRPRLTPEEFKVRVERENRHVEIVGDFKGLKGRVRVRCRVCGREWEPTCGSLSTGPVRCPGCGRMTI